MRTLAVSGPLGPAALARLCERLRGELGDRGGGVLVCDVGGLRPSDAGTVAALARLQLIARRAGGRIELRDASPELLELLDLCGLAEILPARTGSGLEPVRKAEEREQPLRVEERVQRRDPPV